MQLPIIVTNRWARLLFLIYCSIFSQTVTKPPVNRYGKTSAIAQSHFCNIFIFFVKKENGKTSSIKFVFPNRTILKLLSLANRSKAGLVKNWICVRLSASLCTVVPLYPKTFFIFFTRRHIQLFFLFNATTGLVTNSSLGP